MKKLLALAAAVYLLVLSAAAQVTEKPLVVIDGRIRNINPAEINSLTISSMTVLKDQSALSAYGYAGRNGALLINTYGPPSEYKKTSDMLVMVDGNEYTGSLKDIYPSTIESVSVLKNSQATKAYGEAGKNGVIIVTTRKTEWAKPEKDWKLIWEDNFDGNSLDTTKWTLISTKPGQRASDWNRHMISDNRVYSVKEGNLYLTAIKNPGLENDPRPYLTGGVDSKGKFSFLYGKAEIRARKECAQGAWPALWMMPEEAFYGGWPHSGELDLMEHLNFDGNVHYNVHSRYVDVVKNKTDPKSGSSATMADVTQWNVYGLEWSPDVLIWTLNGKEVFRYPRVEGADPEQIQWPFNKPFYFILSQQLGGSWVGEINPGQLPVSMIIDWVRVYQEK